MFELSFEDVPLVEVMQCLLLGLRILESANFGDETQKIRGKIFRLPRRCGVSNRLLEPFFRRSFPSGFLAIKTTETSINQGNDLGACDA
ncbi:MAG TPA: hypothetical protein EYM33_12500 [Pseudomonadales bacterium]|nr:hypothetical protein [Pseudomonadales bacterium]